MVSSKGSQNCWQPQNNRSDMLLILVSLSLILIYLSIPENPICNSVLGIFIFIIFVCQSNVWMKLKKTYIFKKLDSCSSRKEPVEFRSARYNVKNDYVSHSMVTSYTDLDHSSKISMQS